MLPISSSPSSQNNEPRAQEIPGQITVETQSVAPRAVRAQISRVGSAMLTVGGAAVAGLGADLIAFGKFRYHRTPTLASGIVLTVAGCFSVSAAQLAAAPPLKLKALIMASFGAGLGGVAVAQIGASRYYEAVGPANRNSNVFTAGVVVAALGTAVFLPAVVEQYRAAPPVNRRLVTNLSAATVAVCSSLIVGFGAASYGDMAWARSLFSITMIAAMAVVVASAMPKKVQDSIDLETASNPEIPDSTQQSIV